MVLQSTREGADVRLTIEELDVLNSVIRELASGVDLHPDDFRARVGWDRQRVIELGLQIYALAYSDSSDSDSGLQTS